MWFVIEKNNGFSSSINVLKILSLQVLLLSVVCIFSDFFKQAKKIKFMFEFSDYIIIFSALSSGVLFLLFWESMLYKYYLWVIVAFLLYLVFNFELQLLDTKSLESLNSFETFLRTNKQLVLTLCVIWIPLLGLLSSINQSITFHGRNSKIGVFLFGFLLPIFLIGILAYIGETLFIQLPFLSEILHFLQGSFFYEFFRTHLSTITISVLFLIFYKSIFLLVHAFCSYVFWIIKEEFWWGDDKKNPQDDEDE